MTVSGMELPLLWRLGNAEAEGGGEASLVLVEGAEGGGAEGDGGSHVQDVQGTRTEEAGLRPGDAPGVGESGGRKGHDANDRRLNVPGEAEQDCLLFGSAHLSAKDAPVEGVDELEFGEIGGEQGRLDALHDGGSGGGVGVGDVEGKKEAGVRVNDQKRSRSAASC